MTPDERQLISGLFDRLRQTGLPEKDRDAEQLIKDSLRQIPDAGYMLVQSVLVQEMALGQTQERVEELEEQVRQLERSRPQQGSGSFLGGLFGGGQSRPAAGSVPPTGRQSGGFDQGAGAPMRPAAPWGQQGQPPMAAQAAAGGGFMRTAMATAAGVAGGMLAANAIQGMLGGGSSGAAHAATGGAANSGASGQTDTDTGYASQSEDTSADQNDPGNYDAGAGGGGGGDWGGGGGGDE